MPLDFSEIANDPDLGESVCITRTRGAFGAGGWVTQAVETIMLFGVLTIASDNALEQVPEGDRVKGSLQFITVGPIYETRPGAISDKATWHGEKYRVQSVGPWVDNNFYSAIMVRMRGE